MTNYRRMNASWSPEPDYPKPAGTTKCVTAALDDSVYVVWDYTGPDIDSLDHFRVDVYQGVSLVKSLQVLDPDTDVIVPGLVNGTTYGVDITPHNPGGYGITSARDTVTPTKPQVPAPKLLTCLPGDGLATVTWDWDPTALPAGFVLDWFSYEATRLDTGAVVTEHVTPDPVTKYKATCPLANDADWSVRLVAVAHNQAGKEYVSDLSNPLQVHPEKPVAPYPPKLTGAQIDSGNTGAIVCTFAPGQSGPARLTVKARRWRKPKVKMSADVGPLDLTAWQIRVTNLADSKDFHTYTVNDGQTRTYTTQKLDFGTYAVDVRAQNTVGWSDWSNRLTVTYKPTDSRPFTSDLSYSSWEDASAFYAMFDPGNDVRQGWDTTWKLTRTAAGADVAFEVLAIGAGGGAKGQTVTLGKGGNGGGGADITSQLAGAPAGSVITVFISKGGSTAIDPKDTTVSEGSQKFVATAGKSASSGADAAGAARDRPADRWLGTPAFTWNKPYSEFCGGVTEQVAENPQYPDAKRWGEAGAGTKTSHGGNGFEGLVILRWVK